MGCNCNCRCQNTDQEVDAQEQERIDQRQYNQRKMAWVALVSMLLFTGLVFLPIVPVERLEVFQSIADLFYLAQAGIVSAYMGSEAIVNRARQRVRRGPSTSGPTRSQNQEE